MEGKLRNSGIEHIGNIPWGSHFCQFYETEHDLLETEAAYFKAGLDNNEYCLWILSATPNPQPENKAKSKLQKFFPELDRYIREGKLELVSREDWFFNQNRYDLPTAATHFTEKLQYALSKGFDGIRMNGGAVWLLHKGDDLHQLELAIDRFIAGQPVLMLCNFPLADLMGNEVFDVMNHHQYGIARRHGVWEMFETPELIQTKEKLNNLNNELEKLNESLEQSVADRTRQLSHAIDNLKTEIHEHKKTEALLNNSYQQIRSLIAHLENIREEEQTRISRELHDELGQQLTVLKLNADMLRREIDDPDTALQHKFKDFMAMIDKTIQSVRRIAAELRPQLLDDKDLIAAMRQYLNDFQKRTDIETSAALPKRPIELPTKIQTAFFRIFQEALTNVARHSKASKVHITLLQMEHLLSLSIKDNGKGFSSGASTGKKTLGILGMKERAAIIGAHYQIQSDPAQGTEVVVQLPLTKP